METQTEKEEKDFFDMVFQVVKDRDHICPECEGEGFLVIMKQVDSEEVPVGYSNGYDTPQDYETISRKYECPDCFYSEWIDVNHK